MAKITYTDKEALNEIPSIPAKNKVQASDMNEIKNAVNQNELKVLLIVDSSAPAECSTGDMYYNTTTKLIYTATGTNTWGSTGVNPTQNTLYIDSTNKSTYFYDGSDLISVGGGAGGESLKIGTIVPFAGSTIPDGYLTCDGTAVSRTTYSDLFAVIGTTYGNGDGSTTFNLPNLKGSVLVGLDSSDTDFDMLGKTGGEKTHQLSISELPNDIRDTTNTGSNLDGYIMRGGYTVSGDYNFGGENQPHNNLQPYLVVHYIIKATKTTPVQAEIVNEYSTSTTDGYSCNEVNNLVQDVYSTDEVKINKVWIDGKPIYRKTFSISASGANATWSTNLSSVNCDNVIKVFGFAGTSTLKTAILSDTQTVTFRPSSKAVEIYFNNPGTDAMTGYITIEYTKTID